MANPFDQFDAPKANPFDQFDAPEAAAAAVEAPDAVTGGTRAFARGVPVVGAYLDELNAATNAALDPLVPESVAKAIGGQKIPGATFAERYQNELKNQRGMDTAYDKANPILSPSLQVAGGVAGGAAEMAALPAGAASTVFGLGGKTLAGKMGASALSGAGLGAAHGFGMGDDGLESRVAEAEKGGVLGGALGAAAPVVATGVGKFVNMFHKESAPTLETLKIQAGRLYGKADEVGLAVSKDSVRAATDDIAAALSKEGFHPKIHPKVAVALDELASASNADQSLQQIQNLRRIAQSAGKSVEPDERRIGGILVEKIDDYLENLKPADVISGDAQATSSLLRQARSLWSRFRKGETIETLLERAELTAPNFSGSGAENAIRSEFRNLAKNAKKMRGFSEEERAAIERVAKGGPIGNSLRYLGKLAPTGIVSGALSSGAGAVMGQAVGLPGVGAVALPLLGGVARTGATAVTANNARLASELMRRGGPAVMAPQAAGAQDLARALLQGANPSIDALMLERLNQRSMP